MDESIFKRDFFWELGAETALRNYELGRVGSKSLGFCPVIKDECNPRCICFTNAAVRRYSMRYGSPDIYRIVKAYCSNPMLSGERFPQT